MPTQKHFTLLLVYFQAQFKVWVQSFKAIYILGLKLSQEVSSPMKYFLGYAIH